MSTWTGIDFFIFLIFLLNTLLGMARGASKEIISLLCLSMALVFTIKFALPIAQFINSTPLIKDVITTRPVQNFFLSMGLESLTETTLLHFNYCISMLICFVGIFSMCEAVISSTNVVQVFSFPYAVMDRKLGAALGCIRGYVVSLFLILVYVYMANSISPSFFIDLFRTSAMNLNSLIVQRAPERYKEVLDDHKLFDSKMVLQALEHPHH